MDLTPLVPKVTGVRSIGDVIFYNASTRDVRHSVKGTEVASKSESSAETTTPKQIVSSGGPISAPMVFPPSVSTLDGSATTTTQSKSTVNEFQLPSNRKRLHARIYGTTARSWCSPSFYDALEDASAWCL